MWFVVDVRVNDKYSNNDVLDIIKSNVSCEVTARSTRLNSSGVNETNPIKQVAINLNINTYRSNKVGEFLFVDELNQAIPKYISLLTIPRRTLNDFLTSIFLKGIT